MTTWSDFSAAEPDLAARVRTTLTCTTNCVLGTLRADGSPRLSGIDPFFVEEQLLIGSMSGARKGADLRRDPRLSLHAVPWESRRIAEGRPTPGDLDAKVSGRGRLVTEPEERRRIFRAFADERGFEVPEDGDLFEIEVHTAVTISVEGDELVIDRWTARSGRQVIRRR